MTRRVLAFLLLFVLSFSLFSCGGDGFENVALELRFLDVGQGDATLLRTSAGDILIDAGSDASEEELCLRLSRLGVKSLALAIFTHSDEDHIGGADGVLRAFPAETVWISNFFTESECVERLMDAATKTGARIERVYSGTQRKFDRTILTVLSPIGSMDGADENECSIVLKVVCGDTSALLMGDAGAYTEDLLLRTYDHTQFPCDILKAGHHGSSSSTGSLLISVARPRYAVISCGEGNSYGHPHGETLARLESVGAEVLRTDLSGDIVFYTDGVDLQCASSASGT